MVAILLLLWFWKATEEEVIGSRVQQTNEQIINMHSRRGHRLQRLIFHVRDYVIARVCGFTHRFEKLAVHTLTLMCAPKIWNILYFPQAVTLNDFENISVQTNLIHQL